MRLSPNGQDQINHQIGICNLANSKSPRQQQWYVVKEN
jgi:hypothetical protein